MYVYYTEQVVYIGVVHMELKIVASHCLIGASRCLTVATQVPIHSYTQQEHWGPQWEQGLQEEQGELY